MTSYADLQNELALSGEDLHASELHGLLVGYVSGAGDIQSDRRIAVYENWIGDRVEESLKKLLDAAFDATLENLDEFADFGFRLLVPDDESPIDERVRAIANWCSGFLSGLGESGRSVDALTGDAAEALSDLARIAALTDDVPEGEENEEDLAEIEEFVRVSVLLIFSEMNPPATH